MAVRNYLSSRWHSFQSIFQADGSAESEWSKLRDAIDCAGVYDVHNVLRQRDRLEWSQWHLLIDDDYKAVEISRSFHQEIEKSNVSSDIASKIDTISEAFLRFMPVDDNGTRIRAFFQEAREKDSPKPIIKAFSLSAEFTSCINKHLAANTFHTLKLCCTLFNCSFLARTQEFTEAVTRLLFHPKLDKLLVRNRTVYRGAVIKDGNLIAPYKKDTVIITTTFLSTSASRDVAEIYAADPCGSNTSIFFTYNISNIRRHTALDISEENGFPDEKEILILRYVPFKIQSVARTNNGRRISICLHEYCDE